MMKNFRDYLLESEQAADTPVPGDIFAINIREECLIESVVIESRSDGVVIAADEGMISLLESYGYTFEQTCQECGINESECGCVHEQTELSESHFAVGDRVQCRKSGMKGRVVKMDKDHGAADDQYYTVKRDNGQLRKMAPKDMTKLDEQVMSFDNEQQDPDPNEYDQEGDAAKNELHTMIRSARKLIGMLDNNDNMPEWTQKKITKATDYVDAAADYIASQKERGIMESVADKVFRGGDRIVWGREFDPNGFKEGTVVKVSDASPDVLLVKRDDTGKNEVVRTHKRQEYSGKTGKFVGRPEDAGKGKFFAFRLSDLAKPGTEDDVYQQKTPFGNVTFRGAEATARRNIDQYGDPYGPAKPDIRGMDSQTAERYRQEREEIDRIRQLSGQRATQQAAQSSQNQEDDAFDNLVMMYRDATPAQRRQIEAHPNFSRRPEMLQQLRQAAGVDDTQAMNEQSEEGSPVSRAVLRRIMIAHSGLIDTHGPEQVMAAVDELADRVNIGPDDEIGSSDVSGWVREVITMLSTVDSEPMNNVGEANYIDMKNAAGLTQTEWMQKFKAAGGKIVAQAKMPNGPVIGMLNGRRVSWKPAGANPAYRQQQPGVAEDNIDEAEYQGRKVQLNKKMSNTDGKSKSKVYVKDPKTGNVKKVTFGDPNMKIRKSNPGARKSFRARHNCANPGPKTKARYWSCRSW